MTLGLEEARRTIRADWAESPYYALAEACTDDYWTAGGLFATLFAQLDLTRVIELACGHGRHAARLVARQGADRLGRITLVDVNASNIAACRRRFAGEARVEFLVCSGSDLAPLADGGFTALYCYDAMVHFELHDIIAYLAECHRVLVPGGRALLHVSNYDARPGGNCHDNPHWRNFGSERLFRHLAIRAGFDVLSAQTLDWGGVAALDALVLIERRAG